MSANFHDTDAKMADPVAYDPIYGYTGLQIRTPTRPMPGDQLDAEFAAIKTASDQAVAAIKDVRRSDGALKNFIVTYDSLSADMKARLTALGFDGTAEELEALFSQSKGDVSGNILYPGVDYSLPAGFGAGTAAAINAAMAACGNAGGGVVYVPSVDIPLDGTLDNKYKRVLLRGAGGKAGSHNAGAPTYGAKFIPSFAGTVLKHRTPFASEVGGTPSRNDGGGFEYLTVIGNNLATRLLEVTSVWYGIYDVFLSESVGSEAALFTCGIGGTDLGEEANIQSMEKCRITFRQIVEGANADGVVFSGSANANVSANFNVLIKGLHKNGHAFRGRHCDNNQMSVEGYRISGGTGNLVYLHGQTASLGGAYANAFTFLSGVGPIYAEGTDTSGVTDGKENSIWHLDKANGSPDPTNGTGASWRWETSSHLRRGGAEIQLVVGDNSNQAGFGLAELATEGLLVRHGGQNHIVLSDGTNKWGVSIDASGNLRFVRVAGAGEISLVGAGLGNYANDAAAAAGGVDVGSIYRNGSVLQMRVS